ncbi:uncharacterized protein [Typha latifolia]|uniref:uncharacterized protein n=1 Tax=Typha latifolia TaxID=4733 RepID=UPI003C2C847B
MAPPYCSPKYLFFAVALFCMAASYSRAQDPIQIVARAALCFDNRTVINGCLTAMGINVSATVNLTDIQHNTPLVSKNNSNINSTTALCNSPCFDDMKLMMDCVDGIMSNFQGYSSGLMQGVKAIFQMSCGFGNNNTAIPATRAADPQAATGAKKMATESGKKTSAKSAGDVTLIPNRRWVAMLLTITTVLLPYY